MSVHTERWVTSIAVSGLVSVPYFSGKHYKHVLTAKIVQLIIVITYNIVIIYKSVDLKKKKI